MSTTGERIQYDDRGKAYCLTNNGDRPSGLYYLPQFDTKPTGLPLPIWSTNSSSFSYRETLPVFRKPEEYSKGWGKEVWLANNPFYCGKLLCFKEGAKFSAHFHDLKKESFYILKGKVRLVYFDPQTANELTRELNEGEVVDIPRLCTHQVEALEESIIIEISTQHFEADSYRVRKGDSQTKLPPPIRRPDYGRWTLGSNSPRQDLGRPIKVPKGSHDPRGSRHGWDKFGTITEIRPVTCAWAVYFREDNGEIGCVNPNECEFMD